MSDRKILSGWGRWPRRSCVVDKLSADPLGVAESENPAAPSPPATNGSEPAHPNGRLPWRGATIARGIGRAYGDCAMNPALTLETSDISRFLAFDTATGELAVEAGVSAAEILNTFVPRGWFLPVTPGTMFVTVGGMIAADVHGKNHHKNGSFGDHVLWLELVDASGSVVRCSATAEAELFHATVGGMGLTGHIVRAAFKMIRIETGWIRQRTRVASGLSEAIAIFEEEAAATYSVAWIDCLSDGKDKGRSLIYLGEHAKRNEVGNKDPFVVPIRKRKRVPIAFPEIALNSRTVRLFNKVYYGAGRTRMAKESADGALVDWASYFYPLDAIEGWNLIYGRRGFSQYQCVLPLSTAEDSLTDLLELIANAGLGSFLAVLKRLGPGAPQRPLSFPMEGYTLALDIAMSPEALTLMDQLDDVVMAGGGRVYLAKDSRMRQRTCEHFYGAGVDAFRELRARTGAAQAFGSLLSERLRL